MTMRTRDLASVVLTAAGIALIGTAMPAAANRSLSSVIGPVIVGVALLLGAIVLSRQRLSRVGAVRREARRGIKQIETVLALEAHLSTRRLTVAGANGGCPNCGAPPGPHCVCPKRWSGGDGGGEGA